jgi:hypothetical protein
MCLCRFSGNEAGAERHWLKGKYVACTNEYFCNLGVSDGLEAGDCQVQGGVKADDVDLGVFDEIGRWNGKCIFGIGERVYGYG